MVHMVSIVRALINCQGKAGLRLIYFFFVNQAHLYYSRPQKEDYSKQIKETKIIFGQL